MSMLLQLALNLGCTVLSTATWGAETRLFLEGRAASAAAKQTYSLQPTLLPALISQETVTLTPGSSALQLENDVIGGGREMMFAAVRVASWQEHAQQLVSVEGGSATLLQKLQARHVRLVPRSAAVHLAKLQHDLLVVRVAAVYSLEKLRLAALDALKRERLNA